MNANVRIGAKLSDVIILINNSETETENETETTTTTTTTTTTLSHEESIKYNDVIKLETVAFRAISSAEIAYKFPPGHRPGLDWGSLQRSPDPLVGGEGLAAPSPRTPPCLGLRSRSSALWASGCACTLDGRYQHL